MLVAIEPWQPTGSFAQRAGFAGTQGTETLCYLDAGTAGGGTTIGDAGTNIVPAFVLFTKSNSVGPRARWRASKGSAPVGRFTRSFGNNATEGWHRSMPVGIAVAGGPLTMTLNAVATFSGALGIVTSRELLAALSFAGALARGASSTLAASASFAGDLTAITVLARLLDGAVSFAGAIARSSQHTIAGVASFAGDAVRMVSRTFAGVVDFAGALTQQLVLTRTLEGTAAFAGALATAASKALGGALDTAGALSRTLALTLVLAGVVTTQGALSTLLQLTRVVQGVLDATGVLAAVRVVVNAITLSSDLSFTKQLERFKRRLRFRSVFPGADPHRRYPPR